MVFDYYLVVLNYYLIDICVCPGPSVVLLKSLSFHNIAVLSETQDRFVVKMALLHKIQNTNGPSVMGLQWAECDGPTMGRV